MSTPSGGNVFADLGLPDADLLLRVADLEIEVARLRGLLGPLVWHVPTVEVGEGHTFHQCGYCQQLDAHTPDCPWLMASAALATGGPRATAAPGEES